MFEGLHLLQQAYDAMQALKAELETTSARATALFEKVTHMASVHDQIAAIFDDIEPKVEQIIAAKGDSDTANADLLTRAQALQGKIDAAAAALAPKAS